MLRLRAEKKGSDVFEYLCDGNGFLCAYTGGASAAGSFAFGCGVLTDSLTAGIRSAEHLDAALKRGLARVGLRHTVHYRISHEIVRTSCRIRRTAACCLCSLCLCAAVGICSRTAERT